MSLLAGSGCGGLKSPVVIVEGGSPVHTVKPTVIKPAAVEADPDDPSKLEVVEQGVEIPAGYVCFPEHAVN